MIAINNIAFKDKQFHSSAHSILCNINKKLAHAHFNSPKTRVEKTPANFTTTLNL